MKLKLFILLLFIAPVFLKAQTKIDTFKVNYHQSINKDTSELFLEYENGTVFEFWAVGKGKHSFKIGQRISMQHAATDRKNPFVIVYNGDTYTLTPYKPRLLHR